MIAVSAILIAVSAILIAVSAIFIAVSAIFIAVSAVIAFSTIFHVGVLCTCYRSVFTGFAALFPFLFGAGVRLIIFSVGLSFAACHCVSFLPDRDVSIPLKINFL